MNKTEAGDEIDLYKLIHTLWSGKWIIAVFVLQVCLLLSAI